jgi:hypothetical protein
MLDCGRDADIVHDVTGPVPRKHLGDYPDGVVRDELPEAVHTTHVEPVPGPFSGEG